MLDSAERFARTELLLGKRALKKLSKARIAVFGLGAVGSFAVEALARSGVGAFFLVDFDQVRYSNFNRQLLATESSLGMLKAESAACRISQINPYCEVKVSAVFASLENLSSLFAWKPDIVIDAIDSLGPKSELISYCIRHNITIISSMGSGARTNPFSVRVGDISEVRACPLARRLRKRLKKKGINKGVCCIYSLQQPVKNAGEQRQEKEFYERGRKRNPVGTLCYMSGIFGLTIAYEVIRRTVSSQLIT